MSLVQDLGARLRGSADDLPVAQMASAIDRLRGAVQLIAWIRHESARGIGIMPLGQAVEHLEHALRALLVAQEDVAAYLAAIGLAGEAAVATEPVPGRAAAPQPRPETPSAEEREQAAPLRRWWSARVDELTGYEPEPAESAAPDASRRAPAGRRDETARETNERTAADRDAAADSLELLRRVAAHAGGGDRDRLRVELRRVGPPTGLGLAAITPTALRRLAAEVLGHPPGPDDLPTLRAAIGGRVRGLLPQLDPHIGEVLLSRVCRAPSPHAAENAEPAHPADSAIAGSVLTGVLLRRAGRDPAALDRYLGPAHA